MAIEITFLKIVQQDVDQAFEWYEYQQKGLGHQFEIEISLKLIQNNPAAFPQKYKQLRMKLLDHFPYGLLYKIENSETLRIYACLHLRRNISHILKNR